VNEHNEVSRSLNISIYEIEFVYNEAE